MGGFFSKGVAFNANRDIPSLEGKVILVTGGNSGLGKQSVLELAKHNPREIWIGSRSVAKAEEAIADIKTQVPNTQTEFKILEMDLSSFESVSAAVKKFLDSASRLDILILNAGVMAVPEGTTKEGYEVQFGTNHMGHALFTKLLLPLLKRTAAVPKADVRVVVVSSSAHPLAPSCGIDFTTLKGGAPNLSPFTRYGQSKLANILWAQELARRHPELNVTSLHPGVVRTNLGNPMSDNSKVLGFLWILFGLLTSVSLEKGALNQLWAATAEGVRTGEFYMPVGKPNQGNKWTRAPELAVKLYDWTESELQSRS